MTSFGISWGLTFSVVGNDINESVNPAKKCPTPDVALPAKPIKEKIKPS